MEILAHGDQPTTVAVPACLVNSRSNVERPPFSLATDANISASSMIKYLIAAVSGRVVFIVQSVRTQFLELGSARVIRKAIGQRRKPQRWSIGISQQDCAGLGAIDWRHCQQRIAAIGMRAGVHHRADFRTAL